MPIFNDNDNLVPTSARLAFGLNIAFEQLHSFFDRVKCDHVFWIRSPKPAVVIAIGGQFPNQRLIFCGVPSSIR